MNSSLVVAVILIAVIAIVAYEFYVLVKKASQLPEDIYKLLKALYDDVANALTAVINFFETVPAWVAGILSVPYNILLSSLQAVQSQLDNASSYVQGLTNKTAEELSAMKNEINSTLQSAMASAQGDIQTIITQAQDASAALEKAGSAVGTTVVNSWNGVSNGLGTLGTNIGNGASSISKWVGGL